MGNPWFGPRGDSPAPGVTPYQCPHCGSPHGVEVATVKHRFPPLVALVLSCIIRVDKGDVVACAICGTVYVVTPAGVEERKQRTPDVPAPPAGKQETNTLNDRLGRLRWRNPKV